MGHVGWGSRTRTYECQSQSLMPYRLGYTPRLVHLRGFEPLAHGLEVRCSIQLSYRFNFLPYNIQFKILLVHLRGFEPLAHGLEVRCSIQLSYRCLLERVKGIEPSQPAWKAGALPLSYTRILLVEESGFEPLKAKLTDLQSVPFGHSGTPPNYYFGAS